ncbi:hypothetical protein [Roseomonas indoligenes]|uniref:Uncharacterized protein n=1 Tax=Roseomonas indoligenes TaxID=2820811 RepID=A0A940S5Y4_9PROT|nr:hypothetical protein [Pararoseomonas indoligenes]MBP0491487.1 hypothetical protein [Pararoseomonas indoligenes]
MTLSRIEVHAAPEDRGGPLSLLISVRSSAEWSGRRLSLTLGGRELTFVPLDDGSQARATLDVTVLWGREDYDIGLWDEEGHDLSGAAEWVLSGPFFEAVRVAPEDFLDKVQLHHSRFRSGHLLELAAHGFYLRHPETEFVLRGAALTILSHRYLERPPDSLLPQETARVAWLLGEAGPAVAEGAALVHAAEAEDRRVDWRHVRWTVSLATVAAHLSLYDESYPQALLFFEMATRHTHLVHYAKVSALNLVICAFAEGVIAHLLGQPDQARAALVRGVEAVKPIVQAQNLMENVWVLGDLQNVLRASRQCYIALLRLELIPLRASPPMIDPSMQIEVGEVRSPLQRIMMAERVPALAAHLARHGGI